MKLSKTQFLKISSEQAIADNVSDYDDIKLPKRATVGSAGYDFFSPMSFTLLPGETIKIATGIRCRIDEGFVLKIYPRSSFGFKYRAVLDNTVGIIDSDYFNADNEGHIFVKITNNGDKTLVVNKGDAFCQGIFVQYFLTCDDDATGVRTGGIGSTSEVKKEPKPITSLEEFLSSGIDREILLDDDYYKIMSQLYNQ